MPLDTQNGFAFLEALSDDVSVESLGRNFDGLSAHTGMKVRPSTDGNIPSALQLLPGQSFCIGKTTLSLVPEEHSNLPIYSSDLPDSNFESYNHQVSQMDTPQRTARASSTVIETPMPPTDHDSEISTPIIEKITGHAILGRKGAKKWLKSPLKREFMRTVRNASEPSHSVSQPDLKKEDELMADAALSEYGLLHAQPEVKTEDDMADASIAKPLGGYMVDLEDQEIAGVGLENEYPEKSPPLLLKLRIHQEGESQSSGGSRILEESEPLSPPGVRIRPEKDPGTSNHSPVLAASKPLPSIVERVQAERTPEVSGQSPSLHASSDLSPQLDDDADDTPVRKKAKTTAVSHEALEEESEDNLQDEVISVKRSIPAATDRPVSIHQTPLTMPAHSIHTKSHPKSADQHNRRSSTSLAGSKQIRPTIDSDSRRHPVNRLPSASSFNSTEPKPRTPHSDWVWNTISASPSNWVEPNSSMRSTRSTARDEQNSPSSTDAAICIVFASSSSVGDSKPFLKFLSSKGVKIVKSVHDCTVLCVGKELKKTSKVILAVLLGKDIVMDSWVTDSAKGNDLLSIVPYLSRDPEKEAEWGISLEQAIYRGKKGLKILQDYTIHFTPSVKKELGKNGFDELKEIAKCAGARSVSAALPKRSPEEAPSTFVVAAHDDTEVAGLRKRGWRAYVKDIISLSVLRGKLDLESDEFLVKEQEKESKKRKR